MRRTARVLRRAGMQILKFTSKESAANQLTEVKYIQTASGVWDLVIREDENEKHLIVTDAEGGVRVYGDYLTGGE